MIIESVPNISEGRNLKLIQKITKELKKIKKLEIKDIHTDYDHNRSVFTLVGPPSSVFKSIFTITQNLKTLDINKHTGVHPRTGIIDVIPFIPIKNISYQKLIPMVEKFAYQFFQKFKIPVYLYALSSKKPQTQKLSTIRNKGIEFIKKLSLQEKELLPDIFKSEIFHPTLGVSFIGVRYPLIAFNFNFDPHYSNLEKLKKIAKEIRETNGGIKGVQALAFFLPHSKKTQLSINILEAHKNDFISIFHQIQQKLIQNNLEIYETELVGCIPANIIENLTQNFFKLKQFSINKIIKFH